MSRHVSQNLTQKKSNRAREIRSTNKLTSHANGQRTKSHTQNITSPNTHLYTASYVHLCIINCQIGKCIIARNLGAVAAICYSTKRNDAEWSVMLCVRADRIASVQPSRCEWIPFLSSHTFINCGSGLLGGTYRKTFVGIAYHPRRPNKRTIIVYKCLLLKLHTSHFILRYSHKFTSMLAAIGGILSCLMLRISVNGSFFLICSRTCAETRRQ